MEILFKGKKKTYRFTNDGTQYALYEVTKTKKGDSFSPIGYYSKMESALEKVMMLEISESDATTFQGLLAAIREARQFINTLVSENTKP
jgi:hypothetical protein